ncbi:hypothetical protein AUJ66_02295 [Candidatus Desantisbacteria bacterium CG1_02_38_46]|uniref:Big-1 domain-containing protein n=2 Tax=unclassified Candidatus Desantisiibacteriota TaxID=3106372 RepID=A0A1J4SHM3_9BACT|nr:MAG: hypothetical protein AUJ66_02295 [Candidatus Desantisbacteria bacterium CG1_02_38_46]
MTPSRNINAGDISDSICVRAWTINNIKASSYNGTCTFSTSSATGKFASSISPETWTSTIVLQMVQGETYVYYQDTKSGSPTIAVTSGTLENTSQIESVSPGPFNKNSSYIIFTPYTIKADSTSTCTAVVTVCDTYGNPITNKLVSLQTARGNQDTITIITNITDANGNCTFMIISSYVGQNTVTAVVSTYPNDTITRGVNKQDAKLIVHLDFDVNDFSGNGNTGTIYGNPEWIEGKYGYCLKFDGSDYVWYEDNPSLDITNQLTVEAWVKPLSSSSNQGIVNKGYDYNAKKGWRLFQYDNNKYLFQLGSGSSLGGLYSDSLIQTNTWQHVVGVWDGKTIKIAFNGVFQSSTASFSGPIVYTTDKCKIGAFWSWYFNGLVDEVKIYNRALTEDEIKASYQGKANIYFTAYKLNIASSPFSVRAGKEVPLTITLGGAAGGADSSFNDTCLIQSSSDSGQFSADGSSWNGTNTIIVKLVSGETQVYYRDLRLGTPTLTVSRGSEYESSTQINTITAGRIEFISPQFTIHSNETASIRIIASDYAGNTDTNWSETVQLSSNSQRCKFSTDNINYNSPTIVLNMTGGETTFYCKNTKGGSWTISASSYDYTATIDSQTPITGSQANTITQPVLTVTKYHQKKNTSYNTSSIAATTGETIAYKLTITNIGTDTATNLIITDTHCFDTSVNRAISFTGWDTSTAQWAPDSYTYTPDTTSNWQEWGSEPPKPSDNVKGLRWKINSLGPNQTKYIYFEVKVSGLE